MGATNPNFPPVIVIQLGPRGIINLKWNSSEFVSNMFFQQLRTHILFFCKSYHILSIPSYMSQGHDCEFGLHPLVFSFFSCRLFNFTRLLSVCFFNFQIAATSLRFATKFPWDLGIKHVQRTAHSDRMRSENVPLNLSAGTAQATSLVDLIRCLDLTARLVCSLSPQILNLSQPGFYVYELIREVYTLCIKFTIPSYSGFISTVSITAFFLFGKREISFSVIKNFSISQFFHPGSWIK